MQKAALFIALLVITAGCFKIDDAKYENEYFKNVSERIQEAKKTGEDGLTPVPTTVVSLPAAVTPAVTAVKPSPSPSPVAAKKKPTIKELNISADNMKFAVEDKMAVFSGNVIIKAAGALVHADRLKSKDYKKSAEADGDVRVFYKEYGLNLESKKMSYSNGLNVITVSEKVKAKKAAADGNTIVIYCDEADFDTVKNEITAEKIKSRVRMEYQDITAFADKVVYNDEKKELELTGKPVFKRKKSLFLSDRAVIDTDTKKIKLQDNIWSKIYYTDAEKARKEAEKYETP
ncbi:MAG TPA: LptA/OstA family protein [Candidatus Goldiibacteriota bacterium]|nr:LptA/OstA family protein [Candidatus Goldiibacteriota bacterium]HRQ42897.1 LptA/OstA family protein [Candidatus Goldiibacteriota bacterium]